MSESRRTGGKPPLWDKKLLLLLILAAALALLLSLGTLIFFMQEDVRARRDYEAQLAAVSLLPSPEANSTPRPSPVPFAQPTPTPTPMPMPTPAPIPGGTPTSVPEASPQPGPWYEAYAEVADKRVDFAQLQEKNPNIYAWITIPNTVIDYPVVHDESPSGSTYLEYDAYLNKTANGAIYTDGWNTRGFGDPNTLIYGHNMRSGAMFAGLHAFRKADFFAQNEDIYLYMEDDRLHYRIFAAYVDTAVHILAQNDFGDEAVYAAYLREILKKEGNIREGVEVDSHDRIITLVTCVGQAEKRLFIQAVLVGGEEAAHPTE